MYESPMLYKTSSTGKELQWNIFTRPYVEGETTESILSAWEVVVQHGQVDGKIQNTPFIVTFGKNIGKTNETTIEEQADLEAISKYKKQLDKGYSEERGGASKQYKPMLAHSYDDHKAKVTFPCYVQPKLDGMRCIAIRDGDEITLMSRGGKVIEALEHIRKDLLEVMKDGEAFDGELYNHEITFQDLMSLVKRNQENSKKVKYHIYDIVADGSFRERFLSDRMCNLSVMGYESIKSVGTFSCESHDSIKEWHDKFVTSGHEGAIVRHGDCKYKEGGRSNQLLKVKAFFDAEFEIVDVIPSEKRPEQGIFVCCKDNVTFNATPEGTFELKEQYLRDRDKLIGKMLTVRYFEMTTSECPIPRFPIAVGVRDYE